MEKAIKLINQIDWHEMRESLLERVIKILQKEEKAASEIAILFQMDLGALLYRMKIVLPNDPVVDLALTKYKESPDNLVCPFERDDLVEFTHHAWSKENKQQGIFLNRVRVEARHQTLNVKAFYIYVIYQEAMGATYYHYVKGEHVTKPELTEQ